MLKRLRAFQINESEVINYLQFFLKEFIIFPVVAVVMGIATVVVIILIFPVWLFREQHPHTN